MGLSLHQIVRQHRNIYRFGGSWTRTLLAPIPWISVILLALFLYMVHGTKTVSAGALFSLPESQLKEAAKTGATVLLIPVATGETEETFAFFDDVRYSLADAEQREELSELLKERAAPLPHPLLLMADRKIPHGDIMQFVALARSAGVRKIDVSLKEE